MCLHSREEGLKRVRGNVQIIGRTLLHLIGRRKSQGHPRFEERGNRFHILMGGAEKSYCKGPGYKEDEGLWSFSQSCTQKKLPGSASGKEYACQCRRYRFSPWIRKIPGEGSGNPLQYSCLGNPMDREARQTKVHRVTKSQTWLKQLSMHAYTKKSLKDLQQWNVAVK